MKPETNLLKVVEQMNKQIASFYNIKCDEENEDFSADRNEYEQSDWQKEQQADWDRDRARSYNEWRR